MAAYRPTPSAGRRNDKGNGKTCAIISALDALVEHKRQMHNAVLPSAFYTVTTHAACVLNMTALRRIQAIAGYFLLDRQTQSTAVYCSIGPLMRGGMNGATRLKSE